MLTTRYSSSIPPNWSTFKNELKSRRLANENEEIRRLETNPRIRRAFQQRRVDINLPTNAHRICYGHSLEMQEEADKMGYYALNHGQNLNLMVINLVAKELMRRTNPETDLHQFHVLRHPVFIKGATHYSVTDMKRLLSTQTGKTDEDYRDELLCADGYLQNTDDFESALSFFSGTENIAAEESSPATLVAKLSHRMLSYHEADPKIAAHVAQELGQIASEIGEGGNLYTLLIPKEKLPQIGYRAHAFGHPCSCHSDEASEQEILDALQNPTSAHCSYPCGGENPQLRLLTKKLSKENGVRIFVHSTMSKEDKTELKQRIHSLLHQIYPCEEQVPASTKYKNI